MAKFSEALLQGLMRPAFGEQLAQAGKNIGMTPGLLATERQRKEEAAKINAMGPVDLAKYNEQIAERSGDPTKVLQARQVTKGITEQRTQDSLTQLNLARQKAVQENDKSKADSIEETMEKVAANAGLDPSKITGSNAKEFSAIDNQRKEAFRKAYYSVKPQNLEQFVKAAKDAGYGGAILDLEDDRIQRDENQRKLSEGNIERTKPLPVTGVESRLVGLPTDLQEDLKQRLTDIKNLEPSFEAGETWTSGGRQDAQRQLTAIENVITDYKINVLGRLQSSRATLKSSINSAKKALDKLVVPEVSSVDVSAEIPNALESLNSGIYGFINRLDSKDARVKEEAIRLARIKEGQKFEELQSQYTQTIQDLEAQLAEIDNQLGGTPTEEAKSSQEDPLNIRTK